jgi:hypothetical protein
MLSKTPSSVIQPPAAALGMSSAWESSWHVCILPQLLCFWCQQTIDPEEGTRGPRVATKWTPKFPGFVAQKTFPCHIKTFKKISSAFGGNITGGHFKKSNVCYCRSFTHPNTCPHFSIFSHDTWELHAGVPSPLQQEVHLDLAIMVAPSLWLRLP